MTVRIIAEIGVNHNGLIENAVKLIESASKCGADMAKFQTFSAERLTGKSTPKVPYQLRSGTHEESHFEMLKKLELSKADHIFLKTVCEKNKIEFCSTPYSREDAEFLHEIGVKTYKTASADIVDRTLHEFIASIHTEVIIAVGMATIDEINDMMSIYSDNGSQKLVTLLQCVSAYPAVAADMNLNVMKMLQQKYNCSIGFSDHSVGNTCSIAAVALGATVVEKHFTLDKSLPGPDHAASSTPEELFSLVKAIREVELALGDGVKIVCESELDMRRISRKSIIASRDLNKGHILTSQDIAFQRPGTGISPMQYPKILNKKVNVNVFAGKQITMDMLDYE